MNLNHFSSTGKLRDRRARLVYIWLTSDVKPPLKKQFCLLYQKYSVSSTVKRLPELVRRNLETFEFDHMHA